MKLLIVWMASLCFAFELCAQTFPSNFSREQVGGTITNPTVMTFAPDGRIFVAQQSGALLVIKNGTQLTTPFVTLTVNSFGERGLIGIALDPDFAINNFIYLYYTINTAPLKNRISRFTANGDVALAGSEQPILELDNLSTATNHNGGALAFGLDGKLYVAVGDNANTSFPQNLDTYHGKILRINKDGSAPSDNPFFSRASEQGKRIWAYGLRNPYTFSIQPSTGKILVNDVGQNAWEEINDASVGGRNFGWPTTEGPTTNPSFTSPLYAYNHSTGTPTGCAITGGTYFSPANTNYPPTYLGKFFFQDYCNNWIYFIDPTATSPFATLFGSNVGGTSLSIMTGSDGNLYYLSRAAQRLYRIKYTPPTIAPSIVLQPTSLSVSVGQSATFSVTASGTPSPSYQWQKNGGDISNAIQSTYTISSAQLSDAGNYQVIVSNTAGSTTSSSVSLTVTPPNQKPSATVLTPAKNTLYTAGTSISFSGQGTDPEQGDLPPSAFSWQINFHHDTHKHDQPAIMGQKQSSFDIPNQGETSDNVWYRIILTVKDSQGLEGKDSVDVFPRKSTFTFKTIPPDLQLTLDGQPFTAPSDVRSVQGILRTIGVVSPQRIGNQEYEFSSWSNGGSAQQTIPVPSTDVTLTATFSLILAVENSTDSALAYPNPANDWLYLKQDDVSVVTLQDVVGRKWTVLSEKTNQLTAFYIGSLPAGMYVIKMNDSTPMQKIIIQR
jgi:glucose/arabinose dehydrogenase